MKRRQFVSTAAVLGLSGTPVLASDPRPVPDWSLLADCELATFLGDEICIGRLGRLYRAQVPAEADANVLALSLQTAFTRDAETFGDVIARDFEAGNTVQLDGWVLSRTEARQAALYSLIHS